MTLQERQKREIEALKRELKELPQQVDEFTALLALGIEDALRRVQADPETYFKNIDEEE